MNIALELMKYMLIIVCLIGVYGEIEQAITLTRLKASWAWVKWGLGIVLFYFACLYADVIINGSIQNHEVFVRGPLLLLISLVAAGAWLSRRRYQ